MPNLLAMYRQMADVCTIRRPSTSMSGTWPVGDLPDWRNAMNSSLPGPWVWQRHWRSPSAWDEGWRHSFSRLGLKR